MQIGMMGGRHSSRSSTWRSRHGSGHEPGLSLVLAGRPPGHFPSSAFHDVYDMMNPCPRYPALSFSHVLFLFIVGAMAYFAARRRGRYRSGGSGDMVSIVFVGITIRR